MAKRYTDTAIWKNQRWFNKLSPIHKLSWLYITDTCDHSGILKIDFSEFIDDLGLDEFDILDFIKQCNTDFDKFTGKKIIRERVKLLKGNIVWITGFIKFQYENKDLLINPSVPAVYSALTILNSYGIFEEGLSKGYFTLSKEYSKGMLRTKDKDKDKDINTEVEREVKISDTTFLGKMINIFKKLNPKYPEDSQRDATACWQIALKIGKMNGWDQNQVNKKEKDILEKWGVVTNFILSDKWFSTRALFDINNEWQRIIQSMNNSISPVKSIEPHNAQSKVVV